MASLASRSTAQLLPRAPRARVARAPQRVTAFALPYGRDLQQEGPGSGLRHYPEELHQQYDTRRRDDAAERVHHDMLSTEQCYALFPLITHASVPLQVDDREPAGLSALRVGDAGPTTGRRRRPSPADSPTHAHSQVLPYPDTKPTDLRRELLARHAPEVILASTLRQQPQQRGMHA